MKTRLKISYIGFLMLVFPVLLFAQKVQQGKIVGQDGKALVGVTVAVKGGAVQTATDENGVFRITLRTGDILKCVFVGYKTEEIKFEKNDDLNIKLIPEHKKLDDVVVVGYGSQIRKEVTGAVSSVKVSELSETQSSDSFESMLQGRLPGVNIQMNSGEPGATPTVIIRGLAAVARDDASAVSEPLYVVDGVPIISRISNEFSVTSTNVLADLNPSDIEDITVLKDAYAAAIYGSRAANGVILITTRKGKRGKPQISLNLKTGINFVPQLLDVAGGLKERDQVLQLYTQYAPYGVMPPSMYTDINNPFYNNSSDWQAYLYNRSVTQDYSASIRGAGDFGQYSVTMGYLDNRGILFNTGFKRYSTMVGTTFNAFNNKVTINNTLALSRTNQNRNPDELSTNNSSLLPLPNNPLVSGAEVYQLGYDDNLNDRVRFSSDASWKILSHLTYKVSLSLEYVRAMQDKYSQSRRTLRASNSSNLSENRNMLFQNTLNFDPKFGNGHSLNLLIGQSAEKMEAKVTKVGSVAGEQTLSKTVNWYKGNAIGSSNYGQNTLLSYFSRLDYAYQQKYLFGASLRADGSSKFGVDNRWGIFPSVSAGWNFSSEDFLANQKWLSSGKLRGSYGLSGTTWDPNYLALGIMDGGSLDRYNSMLEITYGGKSGFTPTWYDGFRNENLTWVKSQMGNIGLDLSLFNNKVDIVVDVYEKLTKGLLLTTALPTTSGYNEVYRNAADVLNRGFEFSVNSDIAGNKNFSWRTGLNFAYNKNRVVKLPDGNADILKASNSGQAFGSLIRVGAPLNGFFFYESQGIYQTEHDIPVNPQTGKKLIGLQNKKLTVGDRDFKDQNGDYVIDANDRVYAGDPNPKWTGGWTNDFTYKSFSLSVVSTFVSGRSIVNKSLLSRLRMDKGFAGTSSLPNFDNYNIWQKSGDMAKYPTLNPWNGVSQIFDFDSEYVEDGSYFKIKTATLSYTFSKNKFKRMPFDRARVYCTMDNVYTFQNYSGPDAELVSVNGFDNTGGYPMRRMLLFGLSLGL